MPRSERGKRGAERRWGPPGTRVVRIGDLSAAQRRLVIALVEAAKAEQRDAPEAA